MNDDVTDALTYYGAIPSNMLYWSTPVNKDDPWTVEVSVGLAPYEIEVDFG